MASTLVADLECWQILFGVGGGCEHSQTACKSSLTGGLQTQFLMVSSAVVNVLREVKGAAVETLGKFVYFHLFSGESLEESILSRA